LANDSCGLEDSRSQVSSDEDCSGKALTNEKGGNEDHGGKALINKKGSKGKDHAKEDIGGNNDSFEASG
jgi:hypothetical protein